MVVFAIGLFITGVVVLALGTLIWQTEEKE